MLHFLDLSLARFSLCEAPVDHDFLDTWRYILLDNRQIYTHARMHTRKHARTHARIHTVFPHRLASLSFVLWSTGFGLWESWCLSAAALVSSGTSSALFAFQTSELYRVENWQKCREVNFFLQKLNKNRFAVSLLTFICFYFQFFKEEEKRLGVLLFTFICFHFHFFEREITDLQCPCSLSFVFTFTFLREKTGSLYPCSLLIVFTFTFLREKKQVCSLLVHFHLFSL